MPATKMEPRANTSDPRVQAIWEAFKREGWIIGSLDMAKVAVGAVDALSGERKP